MTESGDVKARIGSSQRAHVGETVGLTFNGDVATLFDARSGRALRSDLNAGMVDHG